jgi:hypothetical protein
LSKNSDVKIVKDREEDLFDKNVKRVGGCEI